MHKVLPFDKYEIAPPTASEHRVTLVDNKKNSNEVLAADITLQELYDHVKPGQLLHLTAEVPKRIAGKIASLKAENAASTHKYYSFFAPYTIPGNRVDPKKGKGPGALRCLPMNLEAPVAYYKLNLDRAYQFIEAGSPVEFRLRIKGATQKKEQRMKPGDINNWIWLHDHFPHLRPDFILKSMPEGSRYMIEPVSDGKKVLFVIVKPNKNITHSFGNLTNRLFKVKASVEASVDKGSQGQLPKVVRSELSASGNRNYSPLTGLPREQVEAAFGADSPEHSDLFVDGDGKRLQPSSSRYMVPDKKEKHRTLGGHLVGRTKKSERDRLNKAGTLMSNKQRSNRKYRRELREDEETNPFANESRITP